MFPSDGGNTAGGIPSIPGEPGTLSGAAARLGAAASAMRDWGSELGSTTSGLSGTTWSGQGAVSFKSCVSKLQADHGSAATALGDASSALSSYATVLAECQAKVKTAQAQVAQAQANASSATSQLNAQPLSPHDPGAAAARSYADANIQSTMQQEIGLAVSAAQAAWDQYEAAAARTAAQIGSAIPGWSTISKDIGWLNDKAGFGLVPVGIGFLVPLGRAGVRYFGTENAFDAEMKGWSEENLAPWQDAFESGQLSPEEYVTRLTQYAESEQIARSLFSRGAIQDIASGGITPEMRFAGSLTAFSRVMAGAAVVSDVAEIISPDDSGAVRALDRGMAAANGVISADAMVGGAGSEALGGALGIVDVSSSWIPVAGEVVLAGTALYLAGDWAYNNVKWFHDGIDDVGHGLAVAGDGIAHGAEDVGSGIAHGASDVAHFFGF
jgi:uncharacterized protein YukE